MLISGDNKILINSEYVEAYEAGDHTVFMYLASGKEVRAGKYESADQSRYAIGLLENAILDEEKIFEFPHARDIEERLNIARQHKSKVANRKVSHGGS